MAVPTKVFVLPTENRKIGPLDGPFVLGIEPRDANEMQAADTELLATIIEFVRQVARGVSCYNKNEFEYSSNLTSYAAECLSEIQSERPEAAVRLEGLIFDCSRLPDSTRANPIWKLDRAILRALPGVMFTE